MGAAGLLGCLRRLPGGGMRRTGLKRDGFLVCGLAGGALRRHRFCEPAGLPGFGARPRAWLLRRRFGPRLLKPSHLGLNRNEAKADRLNFREQPDSGVLVLRFYHGPLSPDGANRSPVAE